MEGMVGEKGILPERSEWFRSSAIVSTLVHGPPPPPTWILNMGRAYRVLRGLGRGHVENENGASPSAWGWGLLRPPGVVTCLCPSALALVTLEVPKHRGPRDAIFVHERRHGHPRSK